MIFRADLDALPTPPEVAADEVADLIATARAYHDLRDRMGALADTIDAELDEHAEWERRSLRTAPDGPRVSHRIRAAIEDQP